jgi:alpha-galactosidase
VLPVRAANAVGPLEIDQSNGGQGEGDGALLTIGGRVYTRGLGTTAASEVLYYLGGRCSRLVTDVGIDDEAGGAVPASFTVYADDREAATGAVTAGDAPKTLAADLTGATWLRLVTTGTGAAPDGTVINDHTDWAAPVLSCGAVAPDAPVQPVEQTLFSFETGTADWQPANADPGGTVSQTGAFHTDGQHGLQVSVASAGNWFGRTLSEPIDLTGRTALKFDVKTNANGTSGEIAVQVGPESSWCQGGLWTWTNPNSSKTVTEKLSQISCPAGVTLDPTRIRAVWVFLNGDDVAIDNVRAE